MPWAPTPVGITPDQQYDLLRSFTSAWNAGRAYRLRGPVDRPPPIHQQAVALAARVMEVGTQDAEATIRGLNTRGVLTEGRSRTRLLGSGRTGCAWWPLSTRGGTSNSR